MDPQLAACIEACNRAHGVALAMSMNHCLEVGGEHIAPRHFRLMTDCAQICAVASDFMLRTSTFHPKVCGICADVCDACAADCERIGDMNECVAACRACAESCRAMAS